MRAIRAGADRLQQPADQRAGKAAEGVEVEAGLLHRQRPAQATPRLLPLGAKDGEQIEPLDLGQVEVDRLDPAAEDALGLGDLVAVAGDEDEGGHERSRSATRASTSPRSSSRVPSLTITRSAPARRAAPSPWAARRRPASSADRPRATARATRVSGSASTVTTRSKSSP